MIWWRLVGMAPLLLVLICYWYDLVHRVAVWDYFWVCPVTAIFIGCAVLSGRRFFISAAMPWALAGPVAVVISQPLYVLMPWHLHHVASAVALVMALVYWRQTWSKLGFLFGICMLYAYGLLTAYGSNGLINLPTDWWPPSIFTLALGVVFLIVALLILFRATKREQIH